MALHETETILDRKLPFSLAAEQALLGSILIDPNALNEVADVLQASDFYISEHTQIYLALRELFLTNNEIDPVTLIDTLVHKGVYEKAGGEEYIRSIFESTPQAMNITDYARIIKEESTRRLIISVCSEVSEMTYGEQEGVAHILDYAQGQLSDISAGRDSKNFRHIRDVLTSVYENLQALSTNAESVQTTKTGFSGLDTVLSGMDTRTILSNP